MDSVSEGAVPARKLLVRLPVARGLLIAVVDPDVAQETAAERRGAEPPVAADARPGAGALLPARQPPPAGRAALGDPLPAERRGGPPPRGGRRRATGSRSPARRADRLPGGRPPRERERSARPSPSGDSGRGRSSR